MSREITQFLTFLNSNFQLTMELENNSSLKFLDLNITKIDCNVEFNIYRKPITANTVIQNCSNQPIKIKLLLFIV